MFYRCVTEKSIRVLQNIFVYVETYDVNILHQLRFDSSEREFHFKIHPRYFTFSCYLISIQLYTIFQDLKFRRFCLAPNNIDFVLSCPKYILNLLSTIYNHGHNILRLFDTLPNFLFTTSEIKRDY